jgi:hypothetical protein
MPEFMTMRVRNIVDNTIRDLMCWNIKFRDTFDVEKSSEDVE